MHIVGWRKKKNNTQPGNFDGARLWAIMFIHFFLFGLLFLVDCIGHDFTHLILFVVTTCWYLWKDAAFNNAIIYIVSLLILCIINVDTYFAALGIEGRKNQSTILFDIKMLHNITKQYRSHTLNTNKRNRGSPFLLDLNRIYKHINKWIIWTTAK